jgi:DNA-directed RNA polymerase subunit omega
VSAFGVPGVSPVTQVTQEGTPSMMEPKIDDLLAQVDSKYTLVLLAAKRAREINSYYNQLGEGRAEFIPPLVETGLKSKPLSIALEEIAEGKVEAERTEVPSIK